MIKLTVLILFLHSFIVFSQPYQETEELILSSFWEFYTPNFLNTPSSGRGFTGIAAQNDISGIIINPATVNLNSKYQINAQYTYKSRQPWAERFGFDDIAMKQHLFSGSLGFGYRINKNIQTGFVYNNPSSMYFDLGEIIRTDEFGNEIGRYDFFYNLQRHSFNVPFIYKTDFFSAGINFNYTLSSYYFPGEGVTTVEMPDGANFHGDFVTRTTFFKADIGFVVGPGNGFSVGAMVSTGGKPKASFDFPADSLEPDYDVYSTVPWKAGAGVFYSIPKTNWWLGFDYRYTKTSDVNNLKDRHDFHFGVENRITPKITLRTGAFTLLDFRKDDGSIQWIDEPGEYDQFFITLGGSYVNKSLAINLAFLSSQFSSGMIKNAYINGGVTYNF